MTIFQEKFELMVFFFGVGGGGGGVSKHTEPRQNTLCFIFSAEQCQP